MTTVYIGLGSNIDAENNMKAAAVLLRERWPDIRFSSVYQTAAREVEDQEDFLNAVGMFETTEDPESVSQFLKSIETLLKKSPPYRFGPRTMDLDLLLYGDCEIRNPELTIPHTRMKERRFVIEPLSELEPSWSALLKDLQTQHSTKTHIRL